MTGVTTKPPRAGSTGSATVFSWAQPGSPWAQPGPPWAKPGPPKASSRRTAAPKNLCRPWLRPKRLFGMRTPSGRFFRFLLHEDLLQLVFSQAVALAEIGINVLAAPQQRRRFNRARLAPAAGDDDDD